MTGHYCVLYENTNEIMIQLLSAVFRETTSKMIRKGIDDVAKIRGYMDINVRKPDCVACTV